MKKQSWLIVLGGLVLGAGLLAGPTPNTDRDFSRYVLGREKAREKTTSGPNFLWVSQFSDLSAAARLGEVVVRPIAAGNPYDVAGGLAHDWIGTVFIPGVTLNETLAFVQNYDNHKHVYGPEVVESRTISHEGDDYRTYLRLRKQKVLTVILNTEHNVHYTRLDAKHAQSKSYSMRINEVENPGSANEHELSPADDHGFLWKLNSYWRFEERDGGVWVECEAISLTRDIPFGLGGLVKPIIRDLPAESLEKTLAATRLALKKT